MSNQDDSWEWSLKRLDAARFILAGGYHVSLTCDEANEWEAYIRKLPERRALHAAESLLAAVEAVRLSDLRDVDRLADRIHASRAAVRAATDEFIEEARLWHSALIERLRAEAEAKRIERAQTKEPK